MTPTPSNLVFRLELPTAREAILDWTRRTGRSPDMEELCHRVAWAPTLNEYDGLGVRSKFALRTSIDLHILRSKVNFPAWSCGVVTKGKLRRGKWRPVKAGGVARVAVVTRYSTRSPDEIAVDIIGGKIPIDRLVRAGVLRDDSPAWLERRAHWERVAPNDAQRVVIEIYDRSTG